MPTTDPVQIPITGDDKQLQTAIKRAGSSLTNLGNQMSSLGSKMTGMFTVPLMQGLTALNNYGTTSIKIVSDAQGNVDDAQKKLNEVSLKNTQQNSAALIAAQKKLSDALSKGKKATLSDFLKPGDTANITAARQELIAAQEAMSKIPPETIRAANAMKEIQAALAPANTEFNKMKVTLLESLVPIIRDFSPTLISLAKSVGDVAKAFADLPAWQKNAIVEFVALAGISGPVLKFTGGLVSTLGDFIKLSPTLITKIIDVSKGGLAMAGGFKAAAIELGALYVAFTLWKQILDDPTFKKLWAMAAGGLAKTFGASDEYANQVFLQQAQQGGLLTPTAPGANSGGDTYNYINNGISTAARDEVTRLLASLQPGVDRQMSR